MNNIRKIIEERLENAKLDYNQYSEIKQPTIKNYLKGQCHAYQNCLNLIPAPRTEQEILKDFEKLGYEIRYNTDSYLFLVTKNGVTIHINKLMKAYRKYFDNDETNYITIQEHKLLTELFEVIFDE